MAHQNDISARHHIFMGLYLVNQSRNASQPRRSFAIASFGATDDSKTAKTLFLNVIIICN